MTDAPIVVGNHLYGRCRDCDKFVRLTGIFARWHFCLSPEELAIKRAGQAAQDAQRAATSRPATLHIPKR